MLHGADACIRPFCFLFLFLIFETENRGGRGGIDGYIANLLYLPTVGLRE